MAHMQARIDSEEEAALIDDKRWLQVQRIISSQSFARAPQLREILLYITRRLLVDDAVHIPEQEIACNALGRREDFKSYDDNIVRVQVSHLRKKLEQYFSTEGSQEELRLTIPKGTYVPYFEPCSPKMAVVVERGQDGITGSDVIPNPKGTATTQIGSKSPFIESRWAWASLGICIVCMAILIIYIFGKTWASSSAKPLTKGIQNPIVEMFFANNLPVSIVTSDAGLIFLQNELQTDISLNEYMSGDYPANILNKLPDATARDMLQRLTSRRFTSFADLTIANRCEVLGRKYGAKSVIRYAHDLNLHDFQKGNFILIGGHSSNPWVSLFESQLNFLTENNPNTHTGRFRNKNPRSGQQEAYLRGGQYFSSISYADIALVQNISKTGYVLLINGLTQEANEAAMEVLFNHELSSSANKLIEQGISQGKPIEIFLQDQATDGVVREIHVLDVRVGS